MLETKIHNAIRIHKQSKEVEPSSTSAIKETATTSSGAESEASTDTLTEEERKKKLDEKVAL